MILQKNIDNLWERAVLRHLPSGILPNHFTFLRMILAPIIGYLLFASQYWWALALFILAALLDSADGALARKRGLISNLGIWLDPLADKLIIVIFLVFTAYIYPYQIIIWLIAGGEAVAMGVSTLFYFSVKDKSLVKSDWWGKFKMFFEVVAVVFIVFYILFSNSLALVLSGILLGTCIILIIATIFTHINILASK